MLQIFANNAMSDYAFDQRLGDAQPFSLASGRVIGIWLLVTLIGLTIAAASLWFSQRDISQRSALAALAFVEARLDALDGELAQLANEANEDFSFGVCPPTLTAVLVRASVRSMLAQQFAVGYRGVNSACGPEGVISMTLPAQQPNMRLSLNRADEPDAPIMGVAQ
jgi:hypothetical protein